MPTLTDIEKKTLSYLKKPTNKEKLNDLLFVHEIYGIFLKRYLENPKFSELNNELNKFYMRELVPAIEILVKELKLDSEIIGVAFKIPQNYILFSNLLTAKKELEVKAKDIEYVDTEISSSHGYIKELVEFAGVFQGEPTPKFNEIIERAKELIHSSSLAQRKDQGKSFEDELKIGLLKYKDFSIFYNEKNLELPPQLVDVCKLFIENSQSRDEIVIDETIQVAISRKKIISKNSTLKVVSKLRRILKKENRGLDIKRVANTGFKFIAKNIR
ncbi:MAG: hypothetical protein WCI41_04520 [bacterium]